ncbi:MAG: ABC transporter permease subunit [Legionellaceae bacterium]|nr:ABC transporter permease subunit [Legionellaceae bacterium]
MTAFKHHKTWAYAFILPQILITLLFFLTPALRAVYQSLLFSDPFGLYSHFAGWQNYRDLLQEPAYLEAFGVTLILSLSVTFLTMSLGLMMAALVAGRSRGQWFYKSCLIWPYAVAPAIAAILWRFLCQPDIGWLSRLLAVFGWNFNYLVDSKQALLVIILTATWQQFSYNFLFFYAAIAGIPKALSEAALLDGANGWRRFWSVIFPMMAPTSFFLLIMNLIYSFFDTFGIIDVMTRGGPANSTTSLIYKVYQDGFEGMDVSSSAAQSVILMLMVMGLTVLQFRFLDKKVHYQ